jgi:glycosyltransferase involved in cell wall biosynthesis
MRIAIISPYSLLPMRGNITTVARIAHSLEASGQQVIVIPADVTNIDAMESRLDGFEPHIIHGFHAYICGEIARRQAERLGVPCVITTTGSDVNATELRIHACTQYAMEHADSVVCFDESARSQVVRSFPNISDRIAVIHQGVEMPPATEYVCDRIPEDSFVVFLPAALRPVKNIEFPICALSSLARENGNLVLVIAGGILDTGYADLVCRQIAAVHFVIWLGEVPREQIGALYTRADVVINCSHHEGMPNSLLEAMSMGKPVLAVDIPGNQSLVRDNVTGWLYRNKSEFCSIILTLMHDAELRLETGRRAREFVREHFSSNIEAEQYIKLYTALGTNTRLTNQERCP